MRKVALGDTGIQVSRLSFGTAFMGPLSDHLSPQEGAALLLQVLDQGISFWDTSDDYGTHPHVACALQSITRDEVTVSSTLKCSCVDSGRSAQLDIKDDLCENVEQ